MLTHWHSTLVIAALLGIPLLAAGYIYERIGEREDELRNPAPGRLISVGDHRLHLLCKGSVGPTVVIEQGAGEPARLWWPIQDQVAEFASVCTYDRAGYGWSDPAAPGRTIDQRAQELHTLLANSGLPAPYILVAHSYGGMIVRSFARTYPDQTAGLVLVDTPDNATMYQPDTLKFYGRFRYISDVIETAARFGLLRLLNNWIPLDRYGFPFVRPGEYAAGADDIQSILHADDSIRQSLAPGIFGNMPVAVLTHGQPFPGPFAVLENDWSAGQTRLAAMSGNSYLEVAAKSNHMINHDEPALVINAIRRVHSAARNHTPV